MTKQIYILVFVLSVSFNAFGQNESEPNNSFGQANSLVMNDLSIAVQGAINPEDDADYYAVEVPRAGVFVAQILNVPASIEMDLTLFDMGQSEIENEDADGGSPVNLTKLVCDAGTYYFRLRDDGNNDSEPDLYSFTITFDTLDVYECNNQISTAAPIQIGETINARIQGAGDIDYYAVEVSTPGVFVADVTNVPPNIDMEMTLYDEGQNEIEHEEGDNGEAVNLLELVCEPGIYYFRLKPDFSSQWSADFYNFTVEFDTSDIYECNNEIAEAAPISIGQTINAKIRDAADIDYYSVEVPRAGVFVADVTNVPTNMDMELMLYNAGQNPIENGEPYANDGEPVNLNYLVCDVGTYYFSVQDESFVPQSSADFYDFAVVFDTLDVYECNNDFSTAAPIEICDPIIATINSIGDTDNYTFNATQGQSITVNLSNVPNAIYPRIRIYNESQEQIGSDTENPGDAIVYNFLSPATGQFYIRVEDVGDNDSSNQPYTLLLEDNCITNTTTTPSDKSISIYPNPTSDMVVIEFEDASLYTDTHLKIFNTIGKEIVSFNNIENNGQIDISNLPSGLLFFKLENENQSVIKKILKN